MMAQSNGMYDHLAQSLRDMPRQLGAQPKAVLVISAHWEEREFTVMAAARPPMVYDYSGFPEHTYHVQYPAPGLPALAEQVRQLIQGAGFSARLDAQRGFDHGSFAPLVVMYPLADLPVVQLSLRVGYDPAEHLAVGRALAPLREQGVLIVGSGLSYHNLRLFGPGARQPSAAFDAWLDGVLTSAPAKRTAELLDWEKAPFARVCHPQEDHLIPLMAAVGAAERERWGAPHGDGVVCVIDRAVEIAQVGDVVNNMRRQYDHHIVADPSKQVEETVAFLRIEAGGGFVEDQHWRIMDDRTGESDAAAIALRERLDTARDHVGDRGVFRDAGNRGSCGGAVEAVGSGEEAEEVADRQVEIKRRAFGEIAESELGLGPV